MSVANTSVATVNTVQPLNNSSSDFEANRVDVNAVGPSFVNYSASALSNTTAPGPGSDILVGTVILNTGAAGTTAINLDVRAGFNESSLSSDSQVRQNSRITFTANSGSLEVSAVQSDFQISSFTPATRATAGDPVSVSATVTNNGTDAGNKTITYQLQNSTGAVVESRTFQRNLSAGESTDLSFNVDSAGLAAGNYTHVLTTPDDTASVNLSLAGGDGFLQGTVRDTSNNPIRNADIIVTAPGFNETFENATDSNGDYTVRVPGLGEGAPYDVEIRQPGFQSFSTRGITVGPGETARIDVTLVPIVTPGAIEVSPTSSSAFVGETVNYTVTVYNSSSMPRETIEGETVQATSSNPDVTFVGSSSASTGPNGTATFTVTSANVGTSELNFTVVSDPAINTQASVSFIQNGEGSIQGTVLNARTTENVVGASAWAVLADRFDANRVDNLGSTTPVALPANNDTIFVRLVDNETGQIIDNDEYRVQTNNASDTGVTKVEELNTSNAAVGEGFALVDVDGDGDVNFSHTRLAPEDYYAEVSFTGNMTSQERLNDDPEDMSEDFLRLGPTFSPSANLTLMATIDRAERSNANLVDSPLYTNTEGEVTGGTSVHGDFLLNKLFTDFQQGQAYTVIVGGPGFSSDFADTVVAEDGESFEYQRHDGFRIVDEAREPAAVDIVQNGTQDAAGAEFTAFDNQSDEFAQIVQRDGRTIDHIDVMSYDGVGEPINATVIVEVVDNDSVAGGDNVNATYAGVVNESDDAIVDRSRDTVRVTTGEDGKATVLLRADASTDNFTTVKRATLANDLSKSDETNVTFVGVTSFGSASISGRVTNSTDVALRNVAVWASEFDYGPDASTRLGDQEQFRFDVDPLSNTADGVDEGTDQFEIRFLEYNSSIDPATGSEVGYELTANATVTVNDLRAYEFEDFVAQGIDIPANTSFKLYDQVGENGGYTLDPVPAVDLADLETDYRLDATKYDDPGAGRQANPGRASVLPGTTDDANIVIPDVIAAPPEPPTDGAANFQVDSVNAPDSVTAGENLTVSGTVTNVGDAAGTQNLQLEIEGTNVSTGTGAVDIVFVLDDSASMGSQVDAMKSSIITFTDEVEAGGIDARYALVTFKDDNEVDLDYTSDVTELQNTVNALSVSGGGDGPEDSFGAIDTAVGLDSRADAETVVIHVTDAESHYAGDGSGFTDVTRDDVAASLNEPGRSYVAVSPASFFFGDEEGNVTAMALEDVDDGVWFDINEGDFGDLLIDEIATTVRDRASAGTSLSLEADETGSYSITVDTEGIAPGTYNVTVSTENDSASTSTTIETAGPADFPDVTGDGNAATDVDGDGMAEDVDGSGSFDIFDVQALLENFEGDAVQDNADAFDFNEDGSVDIFDVQALLDEL